MQPARHTDFKFNPGFKGDDELERDFIVRKRELIQLRKILRANDGAHPNQHVLIVGPRGAGKTTLARRFAAEIRLNPEASVAWHPVVFGEESYSITTPGEFWLECLFQLQSDQSSPALEQEFRTLRALSNDEELFERAHHAVTEEAARLGRRLALVVENFGDLIVQMGKSDIQHLLHTIATSRDLMLVATSTTRNISEAPEETAFLKIIEIGALGWRDSLLLWSKVSGERLKRSQIRPIQILTGGNPRLIRILAEFVADNVYFALIEKLEVLIDQYTDYFKSQLDNLPTGERKVFVSLLDLWDPALTREVAEAARMELRQTGAYLDRLERRGVVTRDRGRWQAAERLINIYYLMRRHGKASSRVKALVRFMTTYYAPEELQARIQELAHEACGRSPAQRGDYYTMVSALISQFTPVALRSVVSKMPVAFFKDPDLPRPLAELPTLLSADAEAEGIPSQTDTFIQTFFEHLQDDRLREAEAILQLLRETAPGEHLTRLCEAALYQRQERFTEAESVLRSLLDTSPDDQPAGTLLFGLLMVLDRAGEALEIARHLTEFSPEQPEFWIMRGESALEAADIEDPSASYEKALELDPTSDEAATKLAELADKHGNLRKARDLYTMALSVEAPELGTYLSYSDFLFRQRDEDEAERILAEAVERHPNSGIVYFRLALLKTRQSSRRHEADPLFERCLELDSDQPIAWAAYGDYLFSLGRISIARNAWEQALSLKEDSAELWLRNAEFLFACKQAEEAEAALRRSLALDPESPAAWQVLGTHLAKQPNRGQEAEFALEQAIGKSGAGCSPHHELGELHLAANEIEKARLNFEAALQLNQNCYCSARSLRKLAQHGPAHTDFEELLRGILARRPDSSRARYELALYLYEKDQLIEAKTLLIEALERARSVSVHLLLARVLFAEAASDVEGNTAFLHVIDEHPPSPEQLNGIAWGLHQTYGSKRAAVSVELAKRAFATDQSWHIGHTLAFALLDAQDADAALKLLPQLVGGCTERDQANLVDLVIALARTSPQATLTTLQILKSDPGEDLLEPLTVALRRLIGEEVHVAREVFEVSNDILERISAETALALGA